MTMSFYNDMTYNQLSFDRHSVSLNLLNFQQKFNKPEEEFVSMTLVYIFPFYVDLHRDLVSTVNG